MAKRKKPGKIKPIGKPNKKNSRRQSDPQSPTERKQAIADDIESQIYSYQPVLAMESQVRQNDLKTVMGIGGANLKLFIDHYEENYQDITGDKSRPSQSGKSERPDLHQVSRDTTVSQDRKGKTPNRRKPNKPKTSSSRRSSRNS